jgi:superoxide reductase
MEQSGTITDSLRNQTGYKTALNELKGWQTVMKPSGGELLKTDRKSEEHVPVIECRDKVKADEPFTVWITLSKGIAHPNTTEHHIRSIELHFLPDGDKAPYQIGSFEFTAHSESSERPDKDSLCYHGAGTSMKTGKSGTLLALAYCNIHGLWQSSKTVKVV